MPSLADIPTDLLHRDYKLKFLLWLRTLGVDIRCKTELSALWSRATETPLTLEDHESYKSTEL